MSKAGTAPVGSKRRHTEREDDIGVFLKNMDVELECRCRLIEFEAQRRTDELCNAFSNELLKLPKSIRNMGVKEFYEKFGGEINLVLDQDRQRVLESTGFPSADGKRSPAVVLNSVQAVSQTMSIRQTKGGTLKRSSGALQMREQAAMGAQQTAATPMKTTTQNIGETPRVNQFLPETPSTVIAGKTVRPARRGESIMSINGSPLVGGAPSLSPTIALAFAADPSRLPDTLNGKNKEECMTKLMALKDHVATLMETIQNSKDN